MSSQMLKQEDTNQRKQLYLTQRQTVWIRDEISSSDSQLEYNDLKQRKTCKRQVSPRSIRTLCPNLPTHTPSKLTTNEDGTPVSYSDDPSTVREATGCNLRVKKNRQEK